jgi:microcin C transport system substrate-binding protein
MVQSQFWSRLLFLTMGILVQTVPVQAQVLLNATKTGMSLGSAPKHEDDFHAAWASPKAVATGPLTLHASGTFDSLMPFALKNAGPGFLSPLVFETLGERTVDEAFAMYGRMIESIDLAKDEMSMKLRMRSTVKFNDGKSLTAKDVAFSFKLLTGKEASPEYKMYYADVKSCTALDQWTVEFKFKVKNRELPLILLQLPILPEHIYGKGSLIKDFTKKLPVGTGPYVVKSFDFGKNIVYERQKNWWGFALPSTKGQFNFTSITVKYFKDDSAVLEAFKAKEFDVLEEASAKNWATGHVGEKWTKGNIIKERWEHDRNMGSQFFSFNMRRPKFKDPMLRKALALAFDFDWANGALFYNEYKAVDSYYSNSEFNAKDLPGSDELPFLNAVKDSLPAEVFTQKKQILGAGLSGKDRLKESMKILKEAGYQFKEGTLQTKSGEVVNIEFLLDSPSFVRVVEPFVQTLNKLGIKATVKLEDRANYIKRLEKFDFDVVSTRLGQSESPGNEQRQFFHSSSSMASESRNIGGINDKAIDALVEKVVAASDRATLVAATKALDRALWFNYFSIPQWYLNADRLSYWKSVHWPENRPNHYELAMLYLVQFGWSDAP